MAQVGYNLARLRSELKPFRLHWYPRLRSTSDHAALLRNRGELFAPAVVLAGRQTAGRGRGGNAWWSAGGCMTATFVFPVEEHLAPHQLPLIAGLAVRNAAAEITGNDSVQLKWPNDVVWRGRKLAGLLCERVRKADLIGVGLNVNLDPADAPPHLDGRVASLSDIARRRHDMTSVLVTVGGHLRRMLTRRNERLFTEFLREYDQYHALLGKRVAVAIGPDATVSGHCQGIDGVGRLLVRDRRNHVHHIVAGHVASAR